MNGQIGVLVADGDRIFREYVEMLVGSSKSYVLRAAFPLASELLDRCREDGAPELAILSVMMEDGPDGITAAGQLKRSWPDTRIILASAETELDWIGRARAVGVESFWFKADAAQPLLTLMDRTMAGESVYPEAAPERLLGKLPAGELTAQQRRVLRLLTEGLSNREIAARLVISPYTVKDHLDEIMDKADIHSRTALAVRAARLGIVVSEAERLRNLAEEQPAPARGAAH